jgi:NAD-dependent SIR2 family protein deacetylase
VLVFIASSQSFFLGFWLLFFMSLGTGFLFLVIGTSGVVYPAAELPAVAHRAGAYVVEFNLERTPISAYADEVILGPVGRTLPEWWEKARPRQE